MARKGRDCIDAKIRAGRLDPARANEAKRLLDQIETDYLDSLGPEGARIRAQAETLQRLEAEAAVKRRRTLMQIAAQGRIAATIDRAQAEKGLADQGSLIRGVVDTTGMDNVGFRGAVQEQKRIRATAHRLMADALAKFHRNLIGNTKNRAQLLNVGRELYGEATGDQLAREIAQAWRDTAEFLRQSFNAAGGAIGKLDHWRLPQMHSGVKVRSASYETWRDFIAPMLDRAAIKDFDTGLPMSGGRLELLLRDVHETIRTDGWAKREPSGAPMGRSVAARRAEHRVLQFKSFDDWLAYQERFGAGDPFSAMMAHIDGMARDIGAMRAMGPNPAATVRFLGQRLIKTAKLLADDKAAGRAETKADFLETLYGHYIGSMNAPSNGLIARSLAMTREVLTSAQLGGATLSALSDLGFQRVTAKFNGLSHVKIMRRQLSLLNPGNEEDRRLAVRLGAIAEEWSHTASAQMRYTGEVMSNELTRRLADGVLRASGLSAWTQAGRWAFQMEFMGKLADEAGRGFDALTPQLRGALDRYGVSAADWDRIRKSPIYEPGRGGFLRPDDVGDDGLATKLYDMIQSETEFAVPSTSLVGRAALMDRARAGSFAGELMRSSFMYKNFSVTLYNTHLRRMANELGPWNKAKYAANLVIAATLMGALSLQLKEIARGKDPRPMEDLSFWGAAVAQGGGLGIIGDFLFNDYSRFGQGIGTTLSGPVAGLIGDLAQFTAGNVSEAVKGKDTHIGREAVNLVGRYVPGSSIWYARYAFERLLLDEMQRLVDPKAAQSWADKRTAQGRDMGNDYFAPRGQGIVPERPPDFGNALRTLDEGKAIAKRRRHAAGGLVVP
jgi:hypothetical protein